MTMRALLIAGPTASGKSGLALDLAERLGGEVVNADALQVYAELSILTARPTTADLARAPHALYGVLSAREACSAARWVGLARAAMDAAWAQGRVPILVGGTGLYLRALTDGLADIPPIPDTVRDMARAMMAHLGAARFHAELAARDPAAAARLRPSDSQRLVRAFEVVVATGRSILDWQAEAAPEPADRRWLRIALEPDRTELHARIARRFAAMMAAGALEEARAFRALGLGPDRPAAKALGLQPLIDHLDGRIPLDAAIDRALVDTRRYAKRQATWIRTQMLSWERVIEQDSESRIDKICTLFENQG